MQPPAVPHGATGVDFVVVTHESREDLQRSFGSVADAARALGARVLVADNASTDGSLELCLAHGDHVVGVPMGANRGYAAAVNAAAARSDTAVLVVLNPDIECPGPEPIRALVAHLEGHPEAAVAAPALMLPDGRPQSSARVVPNLPMLLARQTRLGGTGWGRRASARYLAAPPDRAHVAVEWVVGAALAIRRSDFDAVGGWDDGFFLYFEDVDFCTRLRRRGREVHFLAGTRLVHAFRQSSERAKGSVLRSRARRAHITSALRFFAKHPAYALRRVGPSPDTARQVCPGQPV